MNRMICSLPLVLLALLAAWEHSGARAQSVAEGKVETFPELGMALPRPEGFERAEAFDGLLQPSTGASIVLKTRPRPLAEVAREFSAAELTRQEGTLLSEQEVTIEGRSGLLLHIAQRGYAQEFVKWILLVGDGPRTHVVTAAVPQESAAALGEVLRNTTLAVSVTQPRPSVRSLPFTVTPADGLVPVDGIARAKIVLLTKDGSIPFASPGDPLFFVGLAVGDVPVEQQHQFAIRRLDALAHAEIDAIESSAEITIDGLPGREIVATGEDRTSGTPLVVHQVILFPAQGGYVLMMGLVGKQQAGIYLPKFQATARSYASVRPGGG